MMIQKIFSFDEYEGFVNELAKHPQYSDPHFTYDKNNLYCSLKSKDKHAYVVLENGITKGLFVFIVLPDNRYVEMLIGFTKEEEAFYKVILFLHYRKFTFYCRGGDTSVRKNTKNNIY